MHKFTRMVLLAASATLVTQVARAQFANGDLVLGFTAPSAANDYVINLGNYSSVVGVGGSSVVDLSSHFSLSTFNSAFSSGLSGVDMGVVGGSIAFSPSYIYVTALRSSLGTPGVAGSTTPASLSHNNGSLGLKQVVAMDNSLGLSGGQSTTVPQAGNTGGYSWFNSVPSATSANGSYYQSTGYNPDGTATGSVIYEDLYGTPNTTSSGAYNFGYEGYFTLDLSGANPSLTFTPSTVAVPEPSAYGLMAGVGLLVICVRRQLAGKSA